MKRTFRFRSTHPARAIRINPHTENAMGFRNKTALLCSLLSILLFGDLAQAQSIQFTVKEIALKNGDSTELGDVFYINSEAPNSADRFPLFEG
jgi:hypothetical protein